MVEGKGFKTVLCYSIADFHTLYHITVILGNWNFKKLITCSIPPVILVLLQGETKCRTIDIGLCFHNKYLYIYVSMINALNNCFRNLKSKAVFKKK